MPVYYYILFLMVLSCGNVEESKEVLKTDANLHIENGVTFYEDAPYSGTVISYYKTDSLAYRASYYQGRKQGKEEKWHSNGVLAVERFYNKGIKVGLHRGWWENSHLKFEFYFDDKGAYHGTAKEWFVDGTLYRDFNYVHGKEEGSQKLYKPNGNIRANYVVRNGERYGLIGLKRCDPVSAM